MTEAEWLVCEDSAEMGAYLSVGCAGVRHQLATDRKLRLFIQACRDRIPMSAVGSQWLDIDTVDAVLIAGVWVRGMRGTEEQDIPIPLRAALLRDIMGNPFRPAIIGHGRRCQPRYGSCLLDSGHPGPNTHTCNVQRLEAAWLSATVLGLAQRIYDENDFSRMPILADALEDGGCVDADILAHCRGKCVACKDQRFPGFIGSDSLADAFSIEVENRRCKPCKGSGVIGPHVCGCWALDLIFGKA